LSVDSEHRKAMRRNLCVSLFLHGAVRTTISKAKEIRSMAEKLITLARRIRRLAGDGKTADALAVRRRLIAELGWRRTPLEVRRRRKRFGDAPRTEHEKVLKVLVEEIAPRFADREGGYTRILHTAERRLGDAGETARLELLPKGDERKGASVSRVKRARHRRAEGLEAVRKRREQRRASAAARRQSKEQPPAEPSSAPVGAPASAPPAAPPADASAPTDAKAAAEGAGTPPAGEPPKA
jgi:large subunit ribosomal protein L17